MLSIGLYNKRNATLQLKLSKSNLHRDYLLISALLIMSGNPAFYLQKWVGPAFAGITVLLICVFQRSLTKEFLLKFSLWCSVFLFIFGVHYYSLGYVSPVYVLGFFTKAFIGAVIFWIVKDNFAPRYFDVMTIICLVSFPFYLIHLGFGDDVLSAVFLHTPSKSIGLYTFRPEAPIETTLRNSGMFWEPGAFEAYINLCLFMNFYRIPYLLKNRKLSLLIMVLAVVTTQSTTGYIIFALLVSAYLVVYSKINKGLLIFIIAGLAAGSVFLFNNLDFLGNKISTQYDVVSDLDGDYDPSRFGAFLFDLHYIQKHPITGNGFHPSTRYADHPFLILQEEAGEDLGHGNGFSGFIASAGLLGMFWYYFTLIQFKGKKARKDAIMLSLVMIVLMQGEHFLIYPFFLGLSFFTFTYQNNYEGRRNSNLLQPKRLYHSFTKGLESRYRSST